MRRKIKAHSTPPPSDVGSEPAGGPPQEPTAQLFGLTAPEPVVRALVWGTVVAGVGAVFLGFLKVWVWIIALEPIALGLVIGEVAAVPSSARHRRPPRWTYLYLFALACFTYLFVHIVFWLAAGGFPPAQSFLSFLRSAPSSATTPLLLSIDSLQWFASGAARSTVLKFVLWAVEGLLMAGAAALAYFGGSVRQLAG